MRRALARLVPAVFLVGVVLAVYGRALHRGFTSEDFLLLRLLREDPPWYHFLAKLASPWLDLQLFQFYRPVSTFLFALEDALFGAAPFGYNLVHTLVHAGNACLVYAIARRIVGQGGQSAFAAALLFALYPLHPNAVVFAASFATLFATAFLLGSFLCHRIALERSSWAWETGSLLLFGLALGSYEASVILPVLLVAHDLLLDRERPFRARLARWLPAFSLLGLYFLLRRLLFGVFVGGYEETGRRLFAPQIRQLLGDLAQSLYRLYAPVFEHTPRSFAPLLFLLLAGLLPIALFWRSARRDLLRPWLFAWIWTIVALAPFAFRPVVPGNGRYWYLAAVGASLAVASLARALATAGSGVWRLAPALAVLVLAGWWGSLLAGYLEIYVEAGRTARSIAEQLGRAASAPGGSPVFVAGVPSFLDNRAGAPVAAVFHYGLADAVSPPFGAGGAPVYPLPPLAVEELLPLATGRLGARIYEWEPGAGRLRQVILSPSSSPAELPVLAPADGARLGPDDLTVTFRPGAGRTFRLIVIARGNPNVTELTAAPAPDGTLRLDLPCDFLRAMERLYGGEVYWWIESRDEKGGLLWTRMRSFRLAI
jgi:dolichyl-phosphate-mannose-protein mannosyltransferase